MTMHKNVKQVGTLKITREERTDGTVIRVFVRSGRQALKFDCLRLGAHYHLDPDGTNRVVPIAKRPALEWTAGAIANNLDTLLMSAGYARDAVQLADEDLRLQLMTVVAGLD